MNIKSFLLLPLVLLGTQCVLATPLVKDAKAIDFSEGIPQGMRTLAENTISLDTLRMKRGNQSLRWDWVGNDQLIYDTPIGYQKQVLVYENLDGHGGSENNPVLSFPKSFVMWIYNTKATTQRLRVQFGRGSEVDCEFDYELNFTGWRTMLIGFDRGDMRGVPREDMNRLTLLAPSAGSGTFYIDMLNTASGVNPKIASPSAQLPDIQIHPRLVSQYESRLLENWHKKPTFNLEPLTAENVATFRAMEKRVDDIYFPAYERRNTTEDKIEGIRKAYKEYNIRREGDEIYGIPVMDGQVYEMYPEYGENETAVRKHTKTWNRDLTPLMLNIAKLYTASQYDSTKEELAEMFINLFDHAYDQGMAPGESLAWIHHYSYRMRPLFPAMYYMRHALKEAGKLDKAVATCRFFSQLNMFYDSETVYNVKGRVSTDADYLQGLQTEALLTALMQEDSPEKVRDLKHYSDYYSKVSANYAAGLDECLKPDGTTFHHAGIAVGYGGRALGGLTRAAYILGAGEHAPAQEVIDRVKKGVELTMQYTMGKKYVAPKAFASIRFSLYNIPTQFLTLPAMLALASNGDETELASLYYQTYTEQGGKNDDQIFWKKKLDEKYAAAPKTYDYTKTTILPFAGVGMHRYKSDWLITVRGHSKYTYAFESWGPNFFRYPLFIGNGYLDVTYGENYDSATGEKSVWIDGYDWRRYPGTTTVRLPYDKMLTNPGQVRDEAGEYLFSDQAFMGGVSTSYNTGVFVFQFKGHDKFGIQSFMGKKSYFMYQDKVLCLGTDIQSGVEGMEVETTLFQTSMEQNVREPNAIVNVSGKNVAFDQNLSKGKNIWLIDNRKTGYFVPTINKGTTLAVTNGLQKNPAPVGEHMTEGIFATAVLKHGAECSNVSYNYVMLADASPEKMATFAKVQGSSKPVMKVLQQNSQAHIVAINEINATAYAVYAPAGVTLKSGVVKQVNKQSTFMTRQVEEGKLLLSVSDPDRNVYDGQDDLLPDGTRCELSIYEREWFYWKSRSNLVQITLKGAWDIEKQTVEMETAENKNARIVRSNDKETVVEFECRDGLSAECLLRKL